MSGIRYEVVQRRVEFIKFGNLEIIKKNAKRPYNQRVIDMMQKLLEVHAKEVTPAPKLQVNS